MSVGFDVVSLVVRTSLSLATYPAERGPGGAPGRRLTDLARGHAAAPSRRVSLLIFLGKLKGLFSRGFHGWTGEFVGNAVRFPRDR